MAGFMPYQFQRLGASPSEFGIWFALTSIGYICGNIFSNRFSKKIGLSKLSLIGCCWSFLSILSMFMCLFAFFNSPIVLATSCFLYGCGNGLILANVVVLSLSSVEPRDSGLANGLMGAMQMALGGLVGSLIIFVGGDENFFIAVLCLLTLSFLSIISCFRAFKNI
jgi:DHA1 family bicyclomycin/chloramphenicol resistance-like MFS transporter